MRTTSLLLASYMYDITAAQYYLRARWYSPVTGRFNRMDPFAGNNCDPQSLHKYLYAHCNPIMNTDPTGLQTQTATETVVTISIGEILASIALMGMLFGPHIKHKIHTNVVRQLATQLQTEVFPRHEIDKRTRQGGYRYFVHGSSTEYWKEATFIDPSRGDPFNDFGKGFYTFPVEDFRGVPRASEYAQRVTSGKGVPFLLIVKIQLSSFSGLTKWHVTEPGYSSIVTEFRNGLRPFLTGYDVVWGPVAKQIGGDVWVQNTSDRYPNQFKFETLHAASQLEIVGLVPLWKGPYLAN